MALPSRKLQVVRDAAPAQTPLEAFYRAHSPYVAHLALRVLGRDVEVDDVVQDVFVASARALDRLPDAGAARAWLGTVTVRVARRRLQARRLLSLFGLDPQPDYGELAAPGSSPEERTELMRVYVALDTLPAKLRIAWALRHVDGQQLEDVARLCECSLATVKRRIAAAEEALRARLGA